MAHLVQQSRRYRSWAGVAALASLITVSYWHLDHPARGAGDDASMASGGTTRHGTGGPSIYFGSDASEAAAGSFEQLASRRIEVPQSAAR